MLPPPLARGRGVLVAGAPRCVPLCCRHSDALLGLLLKCLYMDNLPGGVARVRACLELCEQALLEARARVPSVARRMSRCGTVPGPRAHKPRTIPHATRAAVSRSVVSVSGSSAGYSLSACRRESVPLDRSFRWPRNAVEGVRCVLHVRGSIGLESGFAFLFHPSEFNLLRHWPRPPNLIAFYSHRQKKVLWARFG
jgi:hypothetical protein